MANVIGSLFVELGVNTAAFVEGMNKATYQAKAAAQQIGSSFKGIGGALSELGSELGSFGGVVGQALGSAGTAVSAFAKHMGGLSGTGAVIGGVAIGFAGLAAGAATAGAAAIGIALHAAEAAGHLYELSQSTGVAVKDLSGLGVVAKLVGIDIDSLAKGLERMDKSALAAAQSPQKASNAYRTLGISVTDTSGHLKSTTELFGEVADKFAGMEDGATKTALAMQIFGRAGATLIPVLNKGSEAMKYWVDYGTRVGAVLDGPAAEGAHNFEEQMTKLGLISEGVQNKLMTALLPAIDHIVVALTTFAEKGNTIQQFGVVVGKVLVDVAKIVFEAAYAWEWWSNKIDIWKAKIEKSSIDTWIFLGKTPTDKTRAALAAIDATIKGGTENIQRSADRLAVTLADLESTSVTPAGPGEKKGAKAPAPTIAPVTTATKLPVDEVLKYIATLEQETAAQVALAANVGKTTEEIRKQEGMLEAETAIIKLREGLVTKQASLEENLKNAKAEGASQNVKVIKQIQDELTFVRREITELDANRQHIIDLMEAKKKAADDTAFSKKLVEETEKINQNIVGLEAETKAVFMNAAAQREAAVQAQAAKLVAGHPEADATAVIAALERESKAQYDKEVATKASSITGQLAYQKELELLKSVDTQYGTDRDIHLAVMAQEIDAQNKLQTALNNNALAAGTFGEKFKAVLSELQIESQNTGKNIAQAFKTFFDGVSTQFADMVTTGKYNFTALFTSLENAIIKQLASAALNSLIQKLASLGGSGGEDGGGFGSFIGSLFGGGKAAGGPVAPGVAYLVGENGPETFMPNVPGTIIPNQAAAGNHVNASVAINVHGATDPDTFRRSAPQIASEMYRQLTQAAAHAGTGG